MPPIKKRHTVAPGLDLTLQLHQGAGDNLLLIHGLGCACESFADIWSFPQFADCTILAVDLPGFGDSPRADGFSHELSEQARLLQSLVEQLSWSQVHIVGHSMGGAIGVLLCELLGPRVKSFASIEGNLIGADCGVSRSMTQYSFEDFATKGLPALRETLNFPPSLRMFRKWLDKAAPEAFYKSAASLVAWSDSGELLEKFHGLRRPKIYFYGSDDTKAPVLKRLGEVETVAVPDSGHFVMNDNPRQFYQALAEFHREL